MALTRKCPVCNHQPAKPLFRPKTSPGWIVKCLNCGMVYVSSLEQTREIILDGPADYPIHAPQISTDPNFEDGNAAWELCQGRELENELPSIKNSAIDALQRIELHLDHVSSQRKILDFGSGWGFFLAVAKERGWAPFGLEPRIIPSNYAREKFGLDILTDTLRANSFKSDFFNVITSFQVFEHLPEPQRDLHYLYDALAPNGIILIEVPNFETWTMPIMGSHHRHFLWGGHINFFSLSTLDRLLSDNGFKVIDHYYPASEMSVRYLVTQWLAKYLPKSSVRLIENSLGKTRLWNRRIKINIGDIISIFARKT